MQGKKVFVVDDEEHIRELLDYNLQENGFLSVCFEDALGLLSRLKTEIPDAIILDLMLPGMSGIDACKMIRSDPELKNIPILMLTAKNQEFDKILGLELGADDYVTKPFSVKELIARLRAVMRRFDAAHEFAKQSAAQSHPAEEGKTAEEQNEILHAQDITVDVAKHMVFHGNESLILTLKEFELLRILIINAPNVLSRDALLNKVWGYDYFGDTRTVDVHIKNLRKVLGDKNETYISTIRGVGYRFNL